MGSKAHSKKTKKVCDYSRNGCLKCKKSHVKCDEKLPKCTRCSKRKTSCEYVASFLNNSIENTKMVCDTSSVPGIATQIEDSKNLKVSPNSEISPSGETNNTKKVFPLEVNQEVSYASTTSEPNDQYIPFGSSMINFNDLFSIKKTDVNQYNALGSVLPEVARLHNNLKFPNTARFDIPNDGGPCTYFIDKIRLFDPLFNDSIIPLNNQDFVDFIWTMSRITKFYYTFVLFSDDLMVYIHEIFFKLGIKFPIMQSIMTYHASLHIARLYEQVSDLKAFQLWDRMRIILFKQCIEYLRRGLETATSFSEFVILSFTVVVIFSGNANNSSWRAHLTGCFQLIHECHKLISTVDKNDELQMSALSLYNVILEWYNYTSYMAAISSSSGFTDKMLALSISDPFKSVAIRSNGINFLSGQCSELNNFSRTIYLEIQSFATQGIHLSGLNCAYFALTKHDPLLSKNLEDKGVLLLQELYLIKNEYKYQRLASEDFKMDLTLKLCNKLSFQGLELYLKYFFIGDRNNVETRELLRDILDSFYAMPYKSSCAILRHWIIYMAAIVSLIQKEYFVFAQFITILELLQSNGMEIQSIKILLKVKEILNTKRYELLLSPEFDVVIY